MKNSNAARKIDHETINLKPQASEKRHISGTQFKAVMKAVNSVVHDLVPESTKTAIVDSAVYGIKPGERKELMLQVESEKIVDARHVEVRFVDGANRRYVWSGTTGQAARLRTGQVALIKASAISQDKEGMHIKHCRIVEVA